jgi:HSP20 family protein
MNHQDWAAKGRRHERHGHHFGGDRERHLYSRSNDRAAINIYRTDSSYEMLVFAPGRLREHFHLEVKGRDLQISYSPPEGFPQVDWVHREYSRGGFVRSITMDETVDPAQIQAKYVDGVLQVSLPVVAGQERTSVEIPVS